MRRVWLCVSSCVHTVLFVCGALQFAVMSTKSAAHPHAGNDDDDDGDDDDDVDVAARSRRRCGERQRRQHLA